MTFSDNHAVSRGGAIQNYSTLTINNSTFSGSRADTYGGAILIDSGTVTITNSTFSGNSANSGGGGIYNFTTLTCSTAFSSKGQAATTVLARLPAAVTT